MTVRSWRGIVKKFFHGLSFLSSVILVFGPSASVYAGTLEKESLLLKRSPEIVREELKNENSIDETFVYKTNEIIIRFQESFESKMTLDDPAIDEFAQKHELDTREILSDLDKIVRFTYKEGIIEEKFEELRNDPRVIFVQPNYVYQSQAITTDDTYRNLLWGLDNTGQLVNGRVGTTDVDIDAPEAWTVSEGEDNPVIVAVIDNGVAYNHPDLQGNMWDGTSCVDESGDVLGGCQYGYDFADNDPIPLPGDVEDLSASHGTIIASIIAAVKNNTKGVIGVAPHAKIMALRTDLTSTSIIRAIHFAKENGASIINASWVGQFYDPLMKQAIEDFGGLFITAAGNNGDDNDVDEIYPCAFDSSNIICVASTDQDDALSYFSNYGEKTVDLAAPGENIYGASAFSLIDLEDFESVTIPDLPLGFLNVSGDMQTVATGGSDGIVLYGDKDRSPYSDSSSNIVKSPSYDLSTYRSGYIDFKMSCDTEYNLYDYTDYFVIETSGDDSEYTPIEYEGVPMEIDEVILDFFSDDNSPVGSASYSFHQMLPIPSGSMTDQFRYGIKWISNDTDNNYDGCYIDNIALYGTLDGGDERYEYGNGTSFATPYVAGAAALLEGYHQSLRATDTQLALLSQGDTLSSLLGKVESGSRLNVDASLRFVKSWNDITSFRIPGVDNSQVTIGSDSIEINLPYGTDIQGLIPTITHTGNSVSPASGIAQDFTDTVIYRITAKDGSVKQYTVVASVALSPQKSITSFTFEGISKSTVIDESAGTILVTVPYGTNVNGLIPTMTFIGDSVNPASDEAQDFTNPITYTVTAEDSTTKTYTVRVQSEPNPFTDTRISFHGDDVKDGKTSRDKVKIKFHGTGNTVDFMVSRNRDFDGAKWQSVKTGVSVKIKKKSGKQRFYVRFRDVYGNISKTYSKSVEYVPEERRIIKNSKKNVSQGEKLLQSGKKFSKNATVWLYFSRPDGGYYPKVVIPTDKYGNFSVSYTVNKPKGTHKWYAIDGKSGKKSDTISYTVK